MHLAECPVQMRPCAVRTVSGLIMGSAVFVALTARLIRSAPPEVQSPSSPPAAARHAAWRPIHEGHADLATGVYVREDDDLVVDTPFPIVLRRTYNSADGHPRQFGNDTTHPGEWWIHGNSDPRVPWGDLILADGGRIRFTRISPGHSREGAVLRHDMTPTEFNGALLSWTGSLWQMRFRDGSTALFFDCRGHARPCSLTERRDPDGHTITFVRDRSGLLLKMESEGRSIGFDYDDRKRIVRAYDASKNDVTYRYDDGGRLIQATMSEGTVRRYAYDGRNHLIRIEEPDRVVENQFDESGRWTHQVVKTPGYDPAPYIATAHYVVKNGSVVESNFDDGAGLQVSRYNSRHYVVSETLFADTSTPVTFRYSLDSSTNVSTGAAMSCSGPMGPITRAVQLSVLDDAAKTQAIRSNCVLSH
jgi:YD repeat-containing protein